MLETNNAVLLGGTFIDGFPTEPIGSRLGVVETLDSRDDVSVRYEGRIDMDVAVDDDALASSRRILLSVFSR
jgi:hypothetical protein